MAKPCFRNRKKLREATTWKVPINIGDQPGDKIDPNELFHKELESHCQRINYNIAQIKEKNAEVHANRYVGDKTELLKNLQESIFIYRQRNSSHIPIEYASKSMQGKAKPFKF